MIKCGVSGPRTIKKYGITVTRPESIEEAKKQIRVVGVIPPQDSPSSIGSIKSSGYAPSICPPRTDPPTMTCSPP
eukprot:7136761-Ditylum_brightwellii.AAC.1